MLIMRLGQHLMENLSYKCLKEKCIKRYSVHNKSEITIVRGKPKKLKIYSKFIEI